MIKFIMSRSDWEFLQVVDSGRDEERLPIVVVRLVTNTGQEQATFQLKSFIEQLQELQKQLEAK